MLITPEHAGPSLDTKSDPTHEARRMRWRVLAQPFARVLRGLQGTLWFSLQELITSRRRKLGSGPDEAWSEQGSPGLGDRDGERGCPSSLGLRRAP